MKWLINGRWLDKSTGKIYVAKVFAITDGLEDPVKVLHDNYDFEGMTYLGGSAARESTIVAGLLTPLTEVKEK